MRAKLTGTDAYLAEWRRSEPEPCGDDLEAEADAFAGQIEGEYPQERVRAIVDNKGHAPEA
ncbi:MAG: virulence factor [Geminicoccaceae bacterium]|nr:virulence factor [Geminicoccaceae bacterium]